jgi:hypothetical protein
MTMTRIRLRDLTGDDGYLHRHSPPVARDLARAYLLSKTTTLLSPYYPSVPIGDILTSTRPPPVPSLETLAGLYGLVRAVDWLCTTTDPSHTDRLARMPTLAPDQLHDSYRRCFREQVFRLRALYRSLL